MEREPMDTELSAAHLKRAALLAIEHGDYRRAIAALNAMLPEGDPAKIPRAWLDELREWAAGGAVDTDVARWLAQALTTYVNGS